LTYPARALVGIPPEKNQKTIRFPANQYFLRSVWS
jgi:hypothetical protein